MKTLILALCLGATVAALSANEYGTKHIQPDSNDPIECFEIQPMVELSFHSVTIEKQSELDFVLPTNVPIVTFNLAANVPVYSEHAVCSFKRDSFTPNRHPIAFDFRKDIPSKRFLC